MPSACACQSGWEGLKHGVHVEPPTVNEVGKLYDAVLWYETLPPPRVGQREPGQVDGVLLRREHLDRAGRVPPRGDAVRGLGLDRLGRTEQERHAGRGHLGDRRVEGAVDGEDVELVGLAVRDDREVPCRPRPEGHAVHEVDVVVAPAAGGDRLHERAVGPVDVETALLDRAQDQALGRVGRVDPERGVVGVVRAGRLAVRRLRGRRDGDGAGRQRHLGRGEAAEPGRRARRGCHRARRRSRRRRRSDHHGQQRGHHRDAACAHGPSERPAAHRTAAPCKRATGRDRPSPACRHRRATSASPFLHLR